ncbi:MAG TPA: gephyrin-like molybdotransferase Glp [Pyrinomonadaceae bacterium]
MIPVSEAIDLVKAHVKPLALESVPLADSVGRFLARDAAADSDLPPFDRSQMDGYAVRVADVQQIPARLRIVGESAAGRGWRQEMQAGEAVRIMTGAPVPKGADGVQQVELTRETNNGSEVEILEPVALGRSIVKLGDEITKGKVVLRAGDLINSGAVAVLASFGYARVEVGTRPRVAVLATGSELVSVDEQPGIDQIRDSNNYTIGAYSREAGAVVELLPLAGDDTALLKQQISYAALRSDIVITSGGVSVGVYDFTKTALRELGAEIFFERVRLRPGKPAVFARLPSGPLFFGLPGNPVSVSVTFSLFARAAILAMQGASQTELPTGWAVLARTVKGAMERESYLPATLKTDENARLVAEPLKWGGSSDFVGFARATALIVVPRDIKTVEAGTVVRVLHLPQ